MVHRIIDRQELSLEVITTKLDVSDGSYSINYRDTINKSKMISKNFGSGTEKNHILKFIFESILLGLIILIF